MDESFSFGAWLRRRRKALDLTQAELAEQIGLAVGTVAKLEADARRPSKDAAVRLAACLQIPEHDRAVFLRFARGEASSQRLTPLPGPAMPASDVAVATPSDATAAPPLHILASQLNCLPLQSTPFIGRERDVAAVRERLLQAEVRLLTLTGAGGTGKTRLALQVAADVVERFADGVAFVNLAPIRDQALVVSAIAQALSIKELGQQSLLDMLKRYLGDKQVLLLLDNFEQVLDARLAVAELLSTTRYLKVLVTSREILKLQTEYDYPVPPLALPDLQHPPDRLALSQNEAVALFTQRAQAGKPHFALTTANALVIAEICTRLDGLPLAIELAAARVRLLPPPALAARLTSRLKLLAGGARDLPLRQQTLEATIAWSYDLLTDIEQRVFRRLAVFVDGWTMEAAEAVCNAPEDPTSDVLDLLQSLLDKSLLGPPEEAVDEPRFSMLETIREYALERLDKSGEVAAVRQQHARYFYTLAEEAVPRLRGVQQVTWFRRLEREHENVRAALQWSYACGDVELACRFASLLGDFWWVRGHWSEGRRWFETLLQTSTGIGPALRYETLHWAGMLASAQADYSQAEHYAIEGYALAQRLENQHTLARSLSKLGYAARYKRDYAAAQRYFTESLALFREIGDKHFTRAILQSLGIVASDQGDYAQAVKYHEETLLLSRETANKKGEAYALLNLGVAACSQHNYGRAVVLIEQSLAQFLELGDSGGTVTARHSLGLTALYQGNVTRAAMLLVESLALCRALGDQEELATCLEALAEVALAQNEVGRAVRLVAASDALLRTLGLTRAPRHQSHFEQTVACAKHRIDAETWTAIWSVGETLRLDQVIDEASELAEAAQSQAGTSPPIHSFSGQPHRAGLTFREADVLRLVAQGLTNEQVAQQLFVSPRTVEKHLESIYAKLDVSSRSAATRVAVERGLD